jgi:Cu(I)/Ag(I) efflux system membrane fusion protein
MYGQIVFGGESGTALLVPSEAVIRTGRRTLVMLALEGGRYQPAEVRVGREAGGQTQILAGLNEGERVVASGQFLLDSEASLSGVAARSLDQATAAAGPAVHRASGRVQAIGEGTITLAHGPVPALQWPAMTMTFRIPETVGQGVSIGDQVDFTFEAADGEPTVRSLTRKEAAR